MENGTAQKVQMKILSNAQETEYVPICLNAEILLFVLILVRYVMVKEIVLLEMMNNHMSNKL